MTIKIEDTVRLRAEPTKTGVLVSRSPSGNFGAVEWETGGRTVVLMDTVEAVQPLWSVTMANHLYNPADPSDEPAYFRRTFPGATAADAHAAAVAYGLDAGDCSPVEDVAEVEGPLSAPSGEGVAL